ncbi:MAG: hypothetical protein H0X29_04730 [Parachlamydiaceae bacterium]|nr:hypothetical protein [Parachlamydiaceae bacterium]
MSKMLTILIAIIVLIGSFLAIRYAKDSYKLLPINEKNPLKPTSNFQDWKVFSQTDGTFSALFPVLPQHVVDKIADPITKEARKYDMYAAADEQGTGFIISTITFPKKVDKQDAEVLLKNAVNDMLARNKENKLKKSTIGKFQDSDSLDFELENKEVTVAGKAILHNNILYVLSVADKINEFNVDELNFFMNSFHILDQNSTPAVKL